MHLGSSFGNYVQTLTLVSDVIKLLYGLSFMSSSENLPLLLSWSPGSYSEYLIIQLQPKSDQDHSYKISQDVLNPFFFTWSLIEQLFWINENWHSLKIAWIYHHNPERHLKDNCFYLITARRQNKTIYNYSKIQVIIFQ